MYDDTYMYAIERSPEYLAHYGVRGMRWGVRRALKSGNERRLNRQFNRAQKKLDKLVKQSQNAAKYRKRAIRMGIGAAAAGGLAAAGTSGISSAMTKIGAHGGQAMIKGGKLMNRAGSAMSTGLYNLGKATGNSTLKRIGAHGGQALINAGNAVSRAGTGVSTGLYSGSKAVRAWGRGTSMSDAARTAITKNQMALALQANKKLGVGNAVSKGSFNAAQQANGALKGVSNNTIARIGAGAIGAGLAAGAARNAYKAATAQKREAKFRSEMQKAFKGTKYANQISGGQNRSSQPRQGKKRRRNG